MNPWSMKWGQLIPDGGITHGAERPFPPELLQSYIYLQRKYWLCMINHFVYTHPFPRSLPEKMKILRNVSGEIEDMNASLSLVNVCFFESG